MRALMREGVAEEPRIPTRRRPENAFATDWALHLRPHLSTCNAMLFLDFHFYFPHRESMLSRNLSTHRIVGSSQKSDERWKHEHNAQMNCLLCYVAMRSYPPPAPPQHDARTAGVPVHQRRHQRASGRVVLLWIATLTACCISL